MPYSRHLTAGDGLKNMLADIHPGERVLQEFGGRALPIPWSTALEMGERERRGAAICGRGSTPHPATALAPVSINPPEIASSNLNKIAGF
jgi:hypothetical protein